MPIKVKLVINGDASVGKISFLYRFYGLTLKNPVRSKKELISDYGIL